MGWRHKPRPLKDFWSESVRVRAHNRRLLGLREVAVKAIVGSVGRSAEQYRPFGSRAWLRSSRFRRILAALRAGQVLPPVELYLLAGEYYVLDGHHRVAAAAHLGVCDVDAVVWEFLPDPATDAGRWHAARRAFEEATGLTTLLVSWPEGYDKLLEQVREHAWYLGERRRRPVDLRTAAAHWLRTVYEPTIALLEEAAVLESFPWRTPADTYVALSDHKWYRSQAEGREVSFAEAALDFALRFGRPGRWLRLRLWLASWLRRLRPPALLGGGRRRVRSGTSVV